MRSYTNRDRSSYEHERDKDRRKTKKPKERGHRSRRSSEREEEYHSDSSDVVEIPMAPEPPVISKSSGTKSPINSEGAGDCLSIVETNKLRAKLGLKPLEVGPIEIKDNSSRSEKGEVSDLKKIKDDWGEFYHKPAETFNKKSELEKLREKIREKRDKRKIEQNLARVKSLGDSDGEGDAASWVSKSRDLEKQKAQKREKMLQEMDQEFENDAEIKPSNKKRSKYGSNNLKGLRVGHDIDSFAEEKQLILTLKDQGVLDEDDDTLVNVNLLDNERYKKNIENKKQNPKTYGYDVYEDTFDQFGNPIERGILAKYDDEMDDVPQGSKSFTIGESKTLIIEQQQRLAEVKARLNNKKLESLDMEPLKLASEFYSAEEMTKFKKPKKKIKKIRQKLKADDLLEIVGDARNKKMDYGSRDNIKSLNVQNNNDLSDIKVEVEEDDLEQQLAKARRLKQKKYIIKKDIKIEEIQPDIEEDPEIEDSGIKIKQEQGYITLNETAEFCRTLGDIPTYGMAGNREDNVDMMELDEDVVQDAEEGMEKRQGRWNVVNPEQETKLDDEVRPITEEVSILDEEPDVASGVAAALKLAMSKGYLEKEDLNRPSNSRFAHLQAQHYSIEDKAQGEDDKYNRRNDRFQGPSTEFREKDGFKPNVKLEYIDDNGHLLNAKEAFRYLSHKFHGKGPGKNKIEKRIKKNEQEGLMKKMSSTDTPLNTLSMLQLKQKETHSAYVVLSGKQSHTSNLGKNKI